MKEKIIELLGIRKIVTVIVTGLFAYSVISGTDLGEFGQTIVGMVIGFYFAKSTALDKPIE